MAQVVGLLLTLTTAPALADEALITAQGANILALVDLDTQVVTAQIPVDGAPAGIALSPDRKTAYVTRPEGHGLAIVDLDARRGDGHARPARRPARRRRQSEIRRGLRGRLVW